MLGFIHHVRAESLIDLGRFDEAARSVTDGLAAANAWADPASPLRAAVLRSGLRLAKAGGDADEIARWREKVAAVSLLE